MSFVNGFQRTAVFISGSGSCLQALLDLSEFQNISLVITNKKSALGTLRARRFGVEILVMNSQMSLQMNFDHIHQILKNKRIQKIFLAGFMKIIPDSFISLWKDHIYNIHPSLLPQFKGLNAFELAYQSGADIGVTIHHVTTEMDSGEYVLQQRSSKTADDLQQSAAQILLRRTEQNLVRDYVYKGSILCLRF